MRIPDEQFDEERKRLATEWAYHKDNIFTLTKVELFKGARDARRAFFKPQT
jgi:predicted Zn-dependent peptidase